MTPHSWGRPGRAARDARGRHRKQPRRVEPYAWLGAGAFTLGVGAALVSGAGVAGADTGSTDPSSGSASSGTSAGSSDSNDAAPKSYSADKPAAGARPDKRTADDRDRPGSYAKSDDADDETPAKDVDESSSRPKPQVQLDSVGNSDKQYAQQREAASSRVEATPTVPPEQPAVLGASDVDPNVAAVTEASVPPTLDVARVVEISPQIDHDPGEGDDVLPNRTDPTSLAATTRGAESTPGVAEFNTAATQPAPVPAPTDPSVVSVVQSSAGVLSPDGKKLYVLRSGVYATSDAIDVLDTTTNTIVARIVLDGLLTGAGSTRISGVTPSADGKWIYVSTAKTISDPSESNAIAFIDASTYQVVDYVLVDSARPRGIVVTRGAVLISPDGKTLYQPLDNILCGGICTTGLAVIDTTTRRVVADTPMIGSWVDPRISFSPDGRNYYVSWGDITAFDTATNSVQATIKVPSETDGGLYPTGGVFNADGSKLYVALEYPAKLITVDTRTNTVVEEVKLSGSVTGAVSASRDGARLYVPLHGDAGAVAVIDTASGTVIATDPVSQDFSGTAVLSPDGTRLYLLNENSGVVPTTVTVVDTAANKVIAEVDMKGYAFDGTLLISPDGKRLYVQLYRFDDVNGAEDERSFLDLQDFIVVIDTSRIGKPGPVTPPATTYPSDNPFINGIYDVLVSKPFEKMVGKLGELASFLGVKAINTVLSAVAAFVNGGQVDVTGSVAQGIQSFGEGIMSSAVKSKFGLLYLVGAAVATGGYVLDLAHDTDWSDPGGTGSYALTHPVETLWETAKATTEVIGHVGSVIVGSFGGIFGILR